MSIAVENVTKRFGAFTALDDVSLKARDGEFLALLGPSGSGKTTLLRVMAGLEFADRGSVFFDGEDVSRVPIAKRRVGFVFQQYALFRHMTVAENIAFGLKARRRRERPPRAEIARRVQELLDLIQLGELGPRYPAQLSGGQRQRVALARALAVEPRLLLLDEPFGALDSKVRADLRRWLRALHDRVGLTSVFVTHDQEEALELADRVVVVNRGRIEQIAEPRTIYEEPASAFAFDFVGEANRLPVTVSSGEVRFQGQALSPPAGIASSANGERALLFRPHDVVPTDRGAGAVAGQVTMVRPKGAGQRVELDVEGAGSLAIDLPRDAAVATGERLAFRVLRARLY